jgi:hypothetical protein
MIILMIISMEKILMEINSIIKTANLVQNLQENSEVNLEEKVVRMISNLKIINQIKNKQVKDLGKLQE